MVLAFLFLMSIYNWFPFCEPTMLYCFLSLVFSFIFHFFLIFLSNLLYPSVLEVLLIDVLFNIISPYFSSKPSASSRCGRDRLHGRGSAACAVAAPRAKSFTPVFFFPANDVLRTVGRTPGIRRSRSNGINGYDWALFLPAT